MADIFGVLAGSMDQGMKAIHPLQIRRMMPRVVGDVLSIIPRKLLL
jgi:hypothetical protein